ncbi:MAG TPA: hypothetical protein DDX05_00055, partial [Deltaproteobacteria bacterium]|nr:MAG: hypothetical protein A2X90_09065 [Deltaproteobacteria bacterium GWA2_65_63]HAM34277.1 hypothetical protein [Deltaproteobacteria bacterium]HBG72046.1 hypothetical protein [Deltaproteobacteria bacterium]
MKNIVPRTFALVVIILLCEAGTAHSAGVDMKEGEWEISYETSMSMGGMSMPPSASKSTYCLTREDPVPKSEKDKECRIVKKKVTGNKVSWRMECKKAEGEGEISYRGTTYTGFFKMKMVEDGQTMTMNTKLAGKYLGPCPKGQKSGPTGETAKQVAVANEAVAKGKKQQADMEAQQRKAEAFLKSTAVPADESGACEQNGFLWTSKCDEKVGKLNLQDGEYEITVEEASRFGPNATLSEVKRKTVSLGENEPVPQDLLSGQPTETVKRGKNRITWSASRGGMKTMGGVTYRGASFEGVVRTETDAGSGGKMLQAKKVIGTRIGEAKRAVGRPVSGRDYSGRAYSAKEGGDSSTDAKKILKNPVKGIRNLFGF